jgi:hypothetical protein
MGIMPRIGRWCAEMMPGGMLPVISLIHMMLVLLF